MYLLLEQWLQTPAGFFSTSTRMIFAAVVSLLLVLFFGKSYIALLWRLKIGQPIREGEVYYAKLAELHKEKKNTPTMGGVLFLSATLISMILWSDWASIFVRLMALSLLFFGGMGAMDDWAKLKKKSSSGVLAKTRFFWQSAWSIFLIILMLCPSVFSYLGCSIPKVSLNGNVSTWSEWRNTMFIPGVMGGVAITSIIGWIVFRLIEWGCLVGTPNAVNLTDGLDGLASGLAVLVASTLSLVAFFSNHMELSAYHGLAYVESSGEIAVILSALAGALLGFLWFNCHPAQVFMGDTGSLGIGALLGTSAFLLNQEWLLFLVGIVFVVEALSVMLQVLSCKLRHKKIFRCSPLHHHFEYAGLHEMKVVLRFWIIGLLASAFGILTLTLVY